MGTPGKANSQWAPEVPDGLPAPRYPEHSMSCPAGEWVGSLAWQGAGRVATFPAQSCRTSAFPGLLLTLLRPAEWIRPLGGLGPIESFILCLLSQQSGWKGLDVHSCHLLSDHFQFTLIHGPDIPGSYEILFFIASDFSFTTRHIQNWVLFLLWLHPFILSGVISPLISSNILGTCQPGEFIFQCPVFLSFHNVHGVLRQEC